MYTSAPHTAAVNEAGRKLGEKTVKATNAGHMTAIMWAREQFGTELIWGIEDCRNLSARLERDLLSAGQKVVRVPPKLMDRARKSMRTRGKSDPIDAAAVARAVLREPDLPIASHDKVSRKFKLLTDRRETLVAQRTATINRLHAHVHELDPERTPTPRSLDTAKHQRVLQEWLNTVAGVLAEVARDGWPTSSGSPPRSTPWPNASATASPSSPLGSWPSPAAGHDRSQPVGEAAGISRFKSEAAFACHAGVAPIPVWSGNTAGQMRLSRSGNRQLNTALHTIALTQIRLSGPGQDYYNKLRNEHKPKPDATLPQTSDLTHRLPGPARRPPNPPTNPSTGSGLT